MTLLDAIASFLTTPAYAEEPAQPQEDSEDSQAEAGSESKDGGEDSTGTEDGQDHEQEGEEGGDEADGGEGEEGGEEEEEDEEEEEEPEDPMPKIQEECAKLPACAHAKSELAECTERVKQWDEDDRPTKKKGPKEDCVEEFFEYTHCVSQCAAPKLFKTLA